MIRVISLLMSFGNKANQEMEVPMSIIEVDHHSIVIIGRYSLQEGSNFNLGEINQDHLMS